MCCTSSLALRRKTRRRRCQWGRGVACAARHAGAACHTLGGRVQLLRISVSCVIGQLSMFASHAYGLTPGTSRLASRRQSQARRASTSVCTRTSTMSADTTPGTRRTNARSVTGCELRRAASGSLRSLTPGKSTCCHGHLSTMARTALYASRSRAFAWVTSRWSMRFAGC